MRVRKANLRPLGNWILTIREEYDNLVIGPERNLASCKIAFAGPSQNVPLDNVCA